MSARRFPPPWQIVEHIESFPAGPVHSRVVFIYASGRSLGGRVMWTLIGIAVAVLVAFAIFVSRQDARERVGKTETLSFRRRPF
jgi:hypothetical protein